LVGDVGSGGLAIFRGVRRSETDFFYSPIYAISIFHRKIFLGAVDVYIRNGSPATVVGIERE
jgi:hypothetical protein